MTHLDIMNLWPTIAEFADDMGVPANTVKGMRKRGSVPAWYFPKIIEKANERGFIEVTLEELVNAVPTRKPHPKRKGVSA